MVDPFTTIVAGSVGFCFVALVLLGLFYPGTGAEQLGWRSPRAHAERASVQEADDLEQMLEAANARRRARGEQELTVEGLIQETDPLG